MISKWLTINDAFNKNGCQKLWNLAWQINGTFLSHLSYKWSYIYSYYFSQTLAALQLFMAPVKNNTCHAVSLLWLLTDLFSACLKCCTTAHGEAPEKNREDKDQGHSHFSPCRFKTPQNCPEEILLEHAAKTANCSLPTCEKTLNGLLVLAGIIFFIVASKGLFWICAGNNADNWGTF